MMAYRFGIGERVTYSEKRFPTGVWTTELVVVEQFPRDGLPEYRLRCQTGYRIPARGERTRSVVAQRA